MRVGLRYLVNNHLNFSLFLTQSNHMTWKTWNVVNPSSCHTWLEMYTLSPETQYE